MAMVAPTLWCYGCHHVRVYLLHHFIDGFMIGFPFDIGGRFDGELGHDIVNSSQLGHHIGHCVPRVLVST